MSRKRPPPITPVSDRPQAVGRRRKGRCKATTSKGQPCRSRAIQESGYCFFHDPKKKAKRKAAQSKGGKNALARHRPEPLDLPDVLLTSAHDVLHL